MSFSSVTLCLDYMGMPRDVMLDGRSLGPNVKGAKIDAIAQEVSILTVQIWVDHVDTQRVGRDYRCPQL